LTPKSFDKYFFRQIFYFLIFEPYNSNSIKISMRCDKTNIPMGIEDLKNKVFGFQFHPESFLTENGNIIIKKILSA